MTKNELLVKEAEDNIMKQIDASEEIAYWKAKANSKQNQLRVRAQARKTPRRLLSQKKGFYC